MYKSSRTFPLSLVAYPVLLLVLLFLLAACGLVEGSFTLGTPTADTAYADTTEDHLDTPGPVISAAVTPDFFTGFDCNLVNQIPLDECEALVALYNSTNGPAWSDNNGWLAALSPCTWTGINCSGDHISDISLSYNQLVGTLPFELCDLSHLRGLAAGGNHLNGPIPPELGDLSSLVSLQMYSNQLTGPLPGELGQLANLQTLTLGYNQLEGSIPPSLGKAASLELLDLSHNRFSGSIPAELGNLAKLAILDLSYNHLSGAVPDDLGSSGQIQELDLIYNQLRGAVPENVAQISQRRLWGNQIEGTIATRGQEPIVVDYKGVHFIADPSLAVSVWPEVIAAATDLENAPFWYAAPKHIRFTFADPDLSPGRMQMGINLAVEAQIFIYPLAELLEIEPWGPEQIGALRSLLAERAPLPEGELPLLPVANSAQVFQAQVKLLEFGSIRGLRFNTQHTQEARPVINNRDLFYTFQGLTDESACYLAVFFPLAASLLPDEVEIQDWEEFEAHYAADLSKTISSLDQLPPGEFTPDLTLLDALVTSLEVDSTDGNCAGISSNALAAPLIDFVYGSPNVGW